MSWNYRIVCSKKDGWDSYGICEVYYDKHGEPNAYTDPVDLGGFEEPQDIVDTLKLMIDSVDVRDILDEENIW